MLAAAAILDAGEPHAELSRAQRCLGAPDVERSIESHGARKTPEPALGDVKRRLLLVLADAGSFVAGNHHSVPRDHDLHRRGVDTHEIRDDLEAARRFQHIEGDFTFRRVGRRLIPHHLIE